MIQYKTESYEDITKWLENQETEQDIMEVIQDDMDFSFSLLSK